ncbi:MAG: hypothetical protein IJ055_02295 [Oscillospiraceae bacterium]|nr:hypothetical protein [Oscillospiraceae bacterium]
MKRMAAVLLGIVCGMMLVLRGGTPAVKAYTCDETVGSLLGASGVQSLLETDGADALLGGADPSDPETLTGMSAGDMLSSVGEMAREAVRTPVQLAVLLLGVILLSALARSLGSTEGAAGEVYEVVCTVCAVGVCAGPLSTWFRQAALLLGGASDLMLAFAGVFGAVLTVGGHAGAAAGYQSGIAFLCGLAAQLAVRLIFPVLRMCMAMAIVDAVDPAVSLEGMLRCIRKAAAWVLGLLMSVFLGFLTVQSMVSAAADRAGTKAAKYLISGAVPVVGGAVSDAYSALLGSMGVLRSTVGMTGILALLSLVLPGILELLAARLCTAFGAAAAELFAVPRLTRLLKNLECVLALGFSAAVSFSVMFLVSTAMMLLIANNG